MPLLQLRRDSALGGGPAGGDHAATGEDQQQNAGQGVDRATVSTTGLRGTDAGDGHSRTRGRGHDGAAGLDGTATFTAGLTGTGALFTGGTAAEAGGMGALSVAEVVGVSVGVDGWSVGVDGWSVGVGAGWSVGVDGLSVGVDGSSVGVDGSSVGVDGSSVGRPPSPEMKVR